MDTVFTPLPKGTRLTWRGQALVVEHDGGGIMMLCSNAAGSKVAPWRHEVEGVQVP